MMLVRKDWEAYLDRVTELGLWRLGDFRGNLPSFSHMSAYLRSNDNGRSNLQLMDAMLKTQCKVGDALFKQFGDRVFQQSRDPADLFNRGAEIIRQMRQDK